MSITDGAITIDTANNLPPVVRAKMATNMVDPAEVEGAALADAFVGKDDRVVDARLVGFTEANPSAPLLNALVTSLGAAGGGTIVLPAGTFTLTDSDIQLTAPGVSLRGQGRDLTTVRLPDNSSRRTVVIQGSGHEISGITFDGGTQPYSWRTTSLIFEGATYSSVHDCAFVNMKQPVRITNGGAEIAHDIHVYRNDFGTVHDHAVRAADGAPYNIWVHHNTVDDVLNSGANGETSAFRAEGPNQWYTDNIVHASYDTGLMIAGTAAVNVHSARNVFTTTQVSIFMGSGSSRCSSTDDTVTSVLDHGMHIFTPDAYPSRFGGHSVKNLRVVSAGKCGIQVQGVTYNRITECLIRNCGQQTAGGDLVPYEVRDRSGIVLMSTLGGRLADRNMVTNNQIIDDQTVKTTQHGIFVESSGQDYDQIHANVVEAVAISAVSIPFRAANSTGSRIETNFMDYPSLAIPIQSYTTASRPSPGSRTGVLIRDTTVARVCYSDGTNWRRVDTDAIV